MQRLNAQLAEPAAIKAISGLETYLHQCGLEPSLLELVKTRASQMNGCAFCINMHTNDARRAGETEARLYLLNAWRETDIYTERERAALAWTEAITAIVDGHASDEVYGQVRPHFSDSELVALTTAVGTINLWNRISIAFRAIPRVVDHARGVAP